MLSILHLAVSFAVQAQPAPPPPQPQPTAKSLPGVTRTVLLRSDLSGQTREAIQVRVDFAPGAVFPRHMHSGEEMVYVLNGTLECRLEGQPRVTLTAGDVLLIPSGKIHAFENVGLESASELATYVVEKGKPLDTLIK
jgi:quercetin dioxygenase-like cupin family protein